MKPLDFWTRIGAALRCGGLLGLGRQLRGKPAGIRTSILISLGTAVFVTVGAAVAGPSGDPAASSVRSSPESGFSKRE